MTEWKRGKIEELVTLQRGFDITRIEQKHGNVPVISSGGTSSYHNQAAAKGPGVILGRKGVVGSVYYVKSDYWPHDTTLWVKDFRGNDPRFVFYFFKFMIPTLTQMDVGSANPTLNRNHVHPIEARWPEPVEQKKISEILGSLDDKIDLLHRQNKTLEQLAETLWRQWFVEEAKGWTQTDLREVADHIRQSVSPSKQPLTVFNHYSVPAYDEGREPKKELGKNILSNKFRVLSGSVLISKLNPRFPRIWPVFGAIDESVSICSTEFQVVKPKNEAYFGFIYCFLKSTEVTQELENAVGGTSGSHQRVDPDVIFDLSFPRPPDDKIVEFAKLTNDYWLKIDENLHQIRTLTQIRDTLLPKLMSGEVRVKLLKGVHNANQSTVK